ncbi:MAG TPA: hypothetical protein VNW72_14170 [Chthoniobacterales bacterium]|jgi:hypothetical protein|nr:hypothetical protein [Chthoniobacterales bacterium]
MMKQFGLKRFVVTISILLFAATSMPAETDEPGPFERLFHAMRRAFNEPQHRSAHRSSHKQTQTNEATNSPKEESNTQGATGGTAAAPPSQSNTRTATRVASKKGDDLRYGTPVAGKKGFVTSPFSPDAGYIDVRGFAPGTPVKDPYTGKVFLTP